jgi:hypothetical protein
MLFAPTVRSAGRRIASASTMRTFASAARVAAKEEPRQLAPLFAAAGLAVASTAALYREVMGHESHMVFGRFVIAHPLFRLEM